MAKQVPIGEFVMIRRRNGLETMSGVPLAAGNKWCAVALEFDLAPGGIALIRRRDIHRVRPVRNPDVVQTSWQHQGGWPPPTVDLPLDRTRDLVRRLGVQHTCLEVHYEYDDPSAMLVGVPMAGGRRTFDLLTVDPDATWDDASTVMTYREVSRFVLGSPYVERLLAVAEPFPGD